MKKHAPSPGTVRQPRPPKGVGQGSPSVRPPKGVGQGSPSVRPPKGVSSGGTKK